MSQQERQLAFTNRLTTHTVVIISQLGLEAPEWLGLVLPLLRIRAGAQEYHRDGHPHGVGWGVTDALLEARTLRGALRGMGCQWPVVKVQEGDDWQVIVQAAEALLTGSEQVVQRMVDEGVSDKYVDQARADLREVKEECWPKLKGAGVQPFDRPDALHSVLLTERKIPRLRAESRVRTLRRGEKWEEGGRAVIALSDGSENKPLLHVTKSGKVSRVVGWHAAVDFMLGPQ